MTAWICCANVWAKDKKLKPASLKVGPSGLLLIVSNDLDRAVAAHGFAGTLQAALDNWSNMASLLMDKSESLAAGQAASAFDLDPIDLASPLPRAY